MTRCYSGLAKIGLLLVGAAIVLDCVALFVDISLGRRIVRGEEPAASNFDFSSSLSSAANLAVPLAVIFGGAAFLWWFHCAYRRFGKTTTTDSKPIWAALAWFVPGLNLVLPPRIMHELTSRLRIVVAWWALWMVGGAIQVGLRFLSPATQQGWVYWQMTALFGNLLLLASIGYGLLLIASTRRRHIVTVRPGLVQSTV